MRIPRQGRVLAAVWTASGLVLAIVTAAAVATDRPIADFTRDPSAALQLTTCDEATCAYIGFLSNVTVLVWAATVGAVFVVAWLLQRREPEDGLVLAFLSFGAFTAILALDDTFQVHELVAVRLTENGELLIFGAYALLVAALLVRHRAFVRRTSVALPVCAGALLVVSAVFDRWVHGVHLVEDGSKFVAIATWGTWLVGTGLVALDRSDERPDRVPRRNALLRVRGPRDRQAGRYPGH